MTTFGGVPATDTVHFPRLVAEGTNTVGSTGVSGVVLLDLTSLVTVGETLFISAEEVVTGTSVAMPMGVQQGVLPPPDGSTGDGAILYLSYSDLATHKVSICCNNFNDNDFGVHWKVWAL